MKRKSEETRRGNSPTAEIGAEATRRSNPPTAKTEAETTQLNNNPPAAQVKADVASIPTTDKHHNILAAETEALTNASEQRHHEHHNLPVAPRRPSLDCCAGAVGRQRTQRSTCDGPRPWAVMPKQQLTAAKHDGDRGRSE